MRHGTKESTLMCRWLRHAQGKGDRHMANRKGMLQGAPTSGKGEETESKEKT